MGTPIFDNCDLEAVAEEAARQNRWEFLLTAAAARRAGSDRLAAQSDRDVLVCAAGAHFSPAKRDEIIGTPCSPTEACVAGARELPASRTKPVREQVFC